MVPSADPAVRSTASEFVVRLKQVGLDKASFEKLMNSLQSVPCSSPTPPTQTRHDFRPSHHYEQQKYDGGIHLQDHTQKQDRDCDSQSMSVCTVQNDVVPTAQGDQCKWLARCEQLRRCRAREIERLCTLPPHAPGNANANVNSMPCNIASVDQHGIATRGCGVDQKHARQYPHATPTLASAFDPTTGTLDLSNFDISYIGT